MLSRNSSVVTVSSEPDRLEIIEINDKSLCTVGVVLVDAPFLRRSIFLPSNISAFSCS